MTKKPQIFEIEAKMKNHCDLNSCDSIITDGYSPKSKAVTMGMTDGNGDYKSHSFCSRTCAMDYLDADIKKENGDGEGYAAISSKERKGLKDNQFLDQKNRKLPVVDCDDVKAASIRMNQYQGPLSTNEIKEKLIQRAKELGCVDSLPKTWGIK